LRNNELVLCATCSLGNTYLEEFKIFKRFSFSVS
jgi:hypothetical protein